MNEVIEEITGGSTDLEEPSRVIVFNDDQNSFDHVIALFCRVFGWSDRHASSIALSIHFEGQRIVYEGHFELAEHYFLRLKEGGLVVELS